jgi:uncharacterized protein YbaR (Trm112 family)
VSPSGPTGRPPPAQRAATEARLLEFLVCPLTKGRLRLDAAAQELISDKAALAYPIRNGVPLLTREAARPIED